MTEAEVENLETTQEETPEVAPEAVPSTEEQVDTLLRETLDRFAKLEKEGVPVMRVGPAKHPVIPYENLDQRDITIQEYYRIIAHWFDQAGTPYFKVGANEYPFVLYENLGDQNFDAATYYDHLTKLYEAEGTPFFRIGTDKIPVVPYKNIEGEALSREDYLELLVYAMDTVDDLAVIGEELGKTGTAVHLVNGVEIIYSAEETLADPDKDCDNISLALKVLADRLEEKTDENYNATVVGVFPKQGDGHAFLTLEDELRDEDWDRLLDRYSDEELDNMSPTRLCVIDQGNYSENARNLDLFLRLNQYENLIGGSPLEVRRLANGKGAVHTSMRILKDKVKGHDVLEKDWRWMIVHIDDDYSPDFDPKELALTDWSLYAHTEVRFQDGTRLTYGKITETLENGAERVKVRGALRYIDYPKGSERKTAFFYTPEEEGAEPKIEQLDFRDGSYLRYDETSGEVKQVNFSNGFALFDPSETLRQISYDEGPVEFQLMHPDGQTVRQKTFREESEETPYRSIFYNEDGSPKDYKDWKGKKDDFHNPEELTDEIYSLDFPSPTPAIIMEIVDRRND